MRSLVASLLSVAVMVMGLAVASPAAAVPELASDFGLAAGCCTPSGVSFESQAAGYAQAGAGWVRMGIDWRITEPTRGQYAWTRDSAISTFTSTGLQVLAVLAYTPQWNTDPACEPTYRNKCAPVDVAAYATFAAATVERYDGDGVADAPGSPRVDAWEIWNEPNLANFWRPAPEPARYTALLRGAAEAIRAADPTATIVSAGLSPAGGQNAPVEFLQAMYAAGAAGSFDALGFHPYSYPAMPTKVASWNAWQQMFQAFPTAGQPDSLRSLMVANGDGSKEIWATEYGAPTAGDTNGDGIIQCDADGVLGGIDDGCVTEARQALMVTEAYTQWRAYSWSGPLFWYAYQDLASGSTNRENNFGLVRSDGSLKPAHAAYRAAVLAAVPDLTAPSAPTALRTTAVTRNSVTLAWDPSTDNRGVTGYRVYRGSTLAGTISGTSFIVTGLAKNTSYTFTVRAIDAAGNVSPASATLSARTLK